MVGEEDSSSNGAVSCSFRLVPSIPIKVRISNPKISVGHVEASDRVVQRSNLCHISFRTSGAEEERGIWSSFITALVVVQVHICSDASIAKEHNTNNL